MNRTGKMSPAKRPKRLYVTRSDTGWQVRQEGSSRAIGAFPSQAEATEAAKTALRKSGGELRVHGRDGRIRESLTLGRNAMAKIAAVEGIYLSSDLKRVLNDLDRNGASNDERRRTIARRFRKNA